MFCENCGKELGPGEKFCTLCGAVLGQASGGQTGGRRPMTTLTKVLIVVGAVLVVAGAGVGIYFAVAGGSTGKPKPPPNGKTDNNTVEDQTGTTAERLAYISGKDIHTVALDNTGRKQLTTRGDLVSFAVSPDGSRIAFVAAAGDQRIIYLMKSDGTGISQVTLPEKGLAENPAFDPTGKYIYFTRITPQDLANINNSTPFSEGFERYSIAANKVDHVYTHGDMMEQSIEGLYADPAGGDLYFNLYGSDYPSSVPYKLTLGTPVTESVYMPKQENSTGDTFSVRAFKLTGFSTNGAYVSYFKDSLDGEASQVNACYKDVKTGAETSLASYSLSAGEQGNVSGIEFSRVSKFSLYYGTVTSANSDGTSIALGFYQARAGGTGDAVQIPATATIEKEAGELTVWHLLPVKGK
ncbi:MAG TPA: zinc-ribbon domain-containing protein [Candidatus Anoxymicrobiaceae bacterium]